MMQTKTTLILLIAGLMLGIGITGVSAQDLLNNEFYRQAVEVREQAYLALQEGDYENSIRLSREAQELQQLAREEAQRLFDAFEARAYKQRAEIALDDADKQSLNSAQILVVEDARSYYRDGVLYFEDEDFVISKLSFQNTLALLATGLESVANRVLLPKYYRVRLIPQDRDSFSKIAGYDFVYGDIDSWEPLYERNKEKLVDPNNPDLIHPDILFEIPERAGEVRDGVWEAP